MKRLTWALLSLMLFLGMGTAFAQEMPGIGGGEMPSEVPMPTFTPGNGATVKPGAEITFDIPEGFESAMIYALYTFDAETSLEGEVMELLGTVMDEDYDGPIEYIGAMGGFWDPDGACMIPTDAQQGSLPFKVRMLATADMSTWIGSPVASATYTVEGEAEEITVPTPTLNPASGDIAFKGMVKVEYTQDETGNNEYDVYYIFNNAGFNFADYTTDDDVREAGAKGTATGNIMMVTKTVKAALALSKGGKIVAWSEPVSGTYTMSAPQTPKITPAAGPVSSGTKVKIESDDNLVTKYVDIYYTTDGSVPTLTNGTKYTTSFEITSAVTVKAIAVGITDNTLVSEPAEAAYTIQGAEPTPGDKPAAPTFNPNGGNIAADADITLSTTTTGATIYFGVSEYGVTEETFTACKTEDDLDKEMMLMSGTSFTLDDFGIEDEATILAAAALIDAEGNVTWSDVVTSEEFTIKGGDEPGDEIAQPVITPDPEAGFVNVGTEVTITCATDGVTIYYTTDGSDPADGTNWMRSEYSGPFEISAYSVKDNGEYTVRAVAVKGDATSIGKRAVLMINAATPEIEVEEAVFGAVIEISSETYNAKIYYTLDGSTPTEESAEYSYASRPVLTKSVTVKAIAVYPQSESEVATEEFTVAPVENAAVTLFPVEDNTVGYNLATGIAITNGTPVSEQWVQRIPASVYYTVDGTTEPSKAAYEAQTDKENGAIKMIAVEWKNTETEEGTFYGPVADANGNFMWMTFTEATHLKAIGYLLEGDEVLVTTALYDQQLKIKSEKNPVIAPASGTELHAGDKVVVTNPNLYPAKPVMPDYPEHPGEDATEEELAAYEEAVDAWNDDMDKYDEDFAAWQEAIAPIPATKLYFSFDGTKPTVEASLADNNESVFKTDEGVNVEMTIGKDEKGFYAYVPEILGYNSPADTVRIEEGKLTLEVFAVTTAKEEEGSEGGDIEVQAAKAAGSTAFMYASEFVKASYYTTPATLTFDPVSGSEVDENTAVSITCSDADADIFYMMFESEEAAKAAAWDQEKAELYSAELKPVLSTEKNTIKAAYAREGAEAIADGFFYATYKVKELPAITLTFDPASGSTVTEGTEVTVTANREVEIFYNLYADKAAADADETFMANAKEVKEDGKPVITKAAPYLRCGVTDKGEMKYFDATYTVEVANEDLELAGVSVYPNPSNGEFHLELPVAATVEVFASNGVLTQRLSMSEGNATLNINRSGIYFLRITGEGRTAIKRIIVR